MAPEVRLLLSVDDKHPHLFSQLVDGAGMGRVRQKEVLGVLARVYRGRTHPGTRRANASHLLVA